MQCDPKQKKCANVATGIQVRDCGEAMESTQKSHLLTLEPLQTRLSLGETAREFISLSCAATIAFDLCLIGWSRSPETPSMLQAFIVQSVSYTHLTLPTIYSV